MFLKHTLFMPQGLCTSCSPMPAAHFPESFPGWLDSALLSYFSSITTSPPSPEVFGLILDEVSKLIPCFISITAPDLFLLPFIYFCIACPSHQPVNVLRPEALLFLVSPALCSVWHDLQSVFVEGLKEQVNKELKGMHFS